MSHSEKRPLTHSVQPSTVFLLEMVQGSAAHTDTVDSQSDHKPQKAGKDSKAKTSEFVLVYMIYVAMIFTTGTHKYRFSLRLA